MLGLAALSLIALGVAFAIVWGLAGRENANVVAAIAAVVARLGWSLYERPGSAVAARLQARPSS